MIHSVELSFGIVGSCNPPLLSFFLTVLVKHTKQVLDHRVVSTGCSFISFGAITSQLFGPFLFLINNFRVGLKKWI